MGRGGDGTGGAGGQDSRAAAARGGVTDQPSTPLTQPQPPTLTNRGDGVSRGAAGGGVGQRPSSAATTAASLAFGLPAAASLVANPQPANAGAASDLTDVYFGVGCFWHIQVCFDAFGRLIWISS